VDELLERMRYSWWIGWTLTIFFNWVGFLWIGFRARNWRWSLWGLLYSVPFWASAVLTDNDALWEGWPGDLAVIAMLVGAPISIVHAMAIRGEYARRRQDFDRRSASNASPSPASASRPSLINSTTAFCASSRRARAPRDEDDDDTRFHVGFELDVGRIRPPGEGIELNSASEEELASLPGIGPVLAKRAVAERQARPFESVDDFGETLGLQPRMIDRLRGLVRVEEPEDERRGEPRRGGRVVDY
jgi:hypothetical protein